MNLIIISKTNNRQFRHILLLLIIVFFSITPFYVFAQDKDILQNVDLMQAISQDPMDSNPDLDDSDLPESDITTKIYRSTDNSNDAIDKSESALEPALDVDVINKEDLINMYSDLKKKIILRKKDKNEVASKSSSANYLLPWVLFTVLVVLLFAFIKLIKRIRI